MEEWKKNIKKKNPNGEILCPGAAEGKSVRVV